MNIDDAVKAATAGFDAIEPERKRRLAALAAFIRERMQNDEPARLTFICTHNSRRSQLAQVWAAVAAAQYGIEQVHTFSGGTEATAFNPRAVAALRRAGFVIEDPGGDNPRYAVGAAPGMPPLQLFSKTFEHPDNPQEGFAALMTCSEADQACPFVPGADLRLALPYEDPKVADGTPEETERYDERSHQIATEMLYAFSRVGARK